MYSRKCAVGLGSGEGPLHRSSWWHLLFPHSFTVQSHEVITTKCNLQAPWHSIRLPSQISRTQIILESFSCLSVVLQCTHKLLSGTLVCQFYIVTNDYISQWTMISFAAQIRESVSNFEETCTLQSLVYHESLNPAAPNQTFALHNSETASNIL